MKVKFLKSSLSLLLLPVLLTACYSVEFKPAPDYIVLKRSDPGDVEVRFSRPEGRYDSLGTLVFRDFSGQTDDPTFIRIVRNEAEDRGASGAWIMNRTYYETEQMTTESTSSRGATHGSGIHGQVKGQVGIVNVLLFNRRDR